MFRAGVSITMMKKTNIKKCQIQHLHVYVYPVRRKSQRCFGTRIPHGVEPLRMKALSGIYKVGVDPRIIGDLIPSDTLTVRVADDRVDKLPSVDFFNASQYHQEIREACLPAVCLWAYLSLLSPTRGGSGSSP